MDGFEVLRLNRSDSPFQPLKDFARSPDIIIHRQALKHFMETILVIDDNDEFRDLICDVLLDADYDVRDAQCTDEAFELLKHEPCDLVVCDLQLPFTLGAKFDEFEFSYEVGVRTIQELCSVFPFKPIVAVSALPHSVLERLENRIQTVPILAKPFHPALLLAVIRKALEVQCVQVIQ